MKPPNPERWSAIRYILTTIVLVTVAEFLIDVFLKLRGLHGSYLLLTDLGEVILTTAIIYCLLRRESSARERAVAIQKISERRLANVLETATNAIVGLDEQRRIFLFNRGAERMFGYKSEEIRGRTLDVLTTEGFALTHHPSPVAGFEPADGPSEPRQVMVRRRDGRTFPAEAVLSELREEGGVFYTLILNDVSRRVMAEAALRRSHNQLEARVQQRTRELTALLDISRQVGSTLELEQLFGLILDQLRSVIDYTGAAVFTVDGSVATMVAYRGETLSENPLGIRRSLDLLPCFSRIVANREPVLIDDICADTPLSREIMAQCAAGLLENVGNGRALLAIPMLTKEKVIGLLRLENHQPGAFTPQHEKLAAAVANQAAIALENAVLYRRAKNLAAVEERQRLARELHDSVSQALYAIGLGTHAAGEMIDCDPGRLPETLAYVRNLAQAALIEMRALVFQLHPDSLEQEGLNASLSKVAEAALARHDIQAHLKMDSEEGLPLEVKDTLYRICQEAVWNVAKHARAKAVSIRTVRNNGAVMLEIADDGVGFNVGTPFPGHMGLQSMRERARDLGGDLDIRSAPGRGARVIARIPLAAGACTIPQKMQHAIGG